MKKIFNILWLDDNLEKTWKIVENDDLLQFDTVKFIDECERIIDKTPEKYHAAIFDAKGICTDMTNEGKPNLKGFLRLVRKTLAKRIPVYIYSGELSSKSEGDQEDITLDELYDLGLKENIFFKGGSCDDLLEKIKRDLNQKYQIYVGHEYLLTFFSKGWIEDRYRTENLDSIMELYYIKDIDKAHGNQMRKLIEQMLEKVNDVLKITEIKKDRTSQIINGLKQHYRAYAPAMIGALEHMDEMPNEESHNALQTEFRQLFFDSDFSTFFLVCRWFYKLMLEFESNGYLSPAPSFDPDETITNINNNPTEKQPTLQPVKEQHYDGYYVRPFEEKRIHYINLKIKVIYARGTNNKYLDHVFVTGIRPDRYNKDNWCTFPVDTLKSSDSIDIP